MRGLVARSTILRISERSPTPCLRGRSRRDRSRPYRNACCRTRSNVGCRRDQTATSSRRLARVLPVAQTWPLSLASTAPSLSRTRTFSSVLSSSGSSVGASAVLRQPIASRFEGEVVSWMSRTAPSPWPQVTPSNSSGLQAPVSAPACVSTAIRNTDARQHAQESGLTCARRTMVEMTPGANRPQSVTWKSQSLHHIEAAALSRRTCAPPHGAAFDAQR